MLVRRKEDGVQERPAFVGGRMGLGDGGEALLFRSS